MQQKEDSSSCIALKCEVFGLQKATLATRLINVSTISIKEKIQGSYEQILHLITFSVTEGIVSDFRHTQRN